MNKASLHIGTIVTEIFKHSAEARALVVYDELSPLARVLVAAYYTIIPKAAFVNFEETGSTKVLELIHTLSPGDLVVLVQSTSFRLDAFRIRVHLFELGLKVIEHPHLGRVRDEECEIYLDALAYDRDYYHRVGPAMKARLDRAGEVRIQSGGHTLVYGGAFESAKLNIGDYRGMKNWGGQFPIGEVFTELRDLTQLNGAVALFAFGAQDFSVSNCAELLVIHIKEGRLVWTEHSSPAFESILQEIRQHEGDVWVRELGFGLNRALTRTTQICHDVGIYERMCGVHLSLGSKHALYPKEGFHKKKVKYHVDVFAAVDVASIDGEVIYKDGSYLDSLK